MTTLAADKVRGYELGDTLGTFNDVPVITADILYMGSALGLSGSYARPLVAGDVFLGFCQERADNSTGASGAIRARVRFKGLVEIPVTGVDGNDDIKKAVYASDDDTFTLTSTSNTLIGFVHRHVSGTTCVVAFDTAYQAIP